MNLEHCRKDAKRLLRAISAGDAGALARAREVLGERVQQRFLLTDAQHVVANERGYGSWPVLARETAGPARAESIADTGLQYRPGDAVQVWVLRRERRVSVSDHGAALRTAGAPPDWERACARVHAELEVNITRGGVVWLPVVAVGPTEREVARRIARASLIFFQELLELEP
ncbi:MAG TPA: hypothetical protein VHW96_07615 [Solirubrobacteraceae bacterium]|jgi:hypothetical protein|nr:hypothetical protein [Solirubrobacteraceae bacterium]